MSAPAFAKLRDAFPGRQIILLTIQPTQKKTKHLVAAYAGGNNSTPWVNLVMPHLVDDVVIISSFTTWSTIKSIRERLAGLTIEAGVLMLEPCAPWLGRLKKLLLLAWVLRGGPLYGWRGRGSLNGNRVRLKHQGLLRHHVHGPLQFLSELLPPRPYTNDDLKFDLRPGAEPEAWANAWLTQHNL